MESSKKVIYHSCDGYDRGCDCPKGAVWYDPEIERRKKVIYDYIMRFYREQCKHSCKECDNKIESFSKSQKTALDNASVKQLTFYGMLIDNEALRAQGVFYLDKDGKVCL